MLHALKSNKFLLIAGILVVAICAGLLAIYLLHSEANNKPTPAKPTTTASAAVNEAETPISASNEAEQTDDFANLVDDSLLEQPIAEDPALIKDELVQLQDIQTQLNEQKSMLEQQHNDADKLIELKEKQLAALEKQLATQ